MSLEAAIEANTTALRDLIAAIKAGVPTTTPAPTKQTTAPESTGKKAPAGVTATAAGPSYQDAARAVTELAKIKGTDAARAVLKQFGADKLPEVDPSNFAAVITACEAAAVAVE